MNYQRLYEYRFSGIDQEDRLATWAEIAPVVWELMDRPARIVDPAAGRCEFINSVPAAERWAVDRVAYEESGHREGTKVVVADIMEADLPLGHFDGVFASNFLEHLDGQEAIAAFLERMRDRMTPGGRIGILGPNYRYTQREYWDCADHVVALTHVAVAEHLFAAGFEPVKIIPRFLPYSFRSLLPSSPALVRRYLQTPVLWRVLGKQFFLVGRR